MLRTVLLLSLLLAGAAAEQDERRLKPDHARTPFTAAQIREACPEGRTSTYRLEVPKQDPVLQPFRFVDCDEKGCKLEVAVRKAGEPPPRSRPAVSKKTWKELQAHASFPEKETEITEETITVPAGKFVCLLYTVTKKTGSAETVSRYYFAKKLPGPPVRLLRTVDGKSAFTLTLVEHLPGGKKK